MASEKASFENNASVKSSCEDQYDKSEPVSGEEAQVKSTDEGWASEEMVHGKGLVKWKSQPKCQAKDSHWTRELPVPLSQQG